MLHLMLFTFFTIVFAALVVPPFTSAVFSAPTVTLNLEPKELELLLNTAQKTKHLPDNQQLEAFQVFCDEQGGNLKANIDNVLMKVNVTDDQFKQNMDMAKGSLSSAQAKQTADELETLFLDGSIPFVDKVKKSVEIVNQLPENIRTECQPVLQLINSITRCPFTVQCSLEEQESNQGQQQQQLNQQQQPCFHLKLLKVCTIAKNKIG